MNTAKEVVVIAATLFAIVVLTLFTAIGISECMRWDARRAVENDLIMQGLRAGIHDAGTDQ